ncbi:hypothetical protein BG003_005996 [Podila horticola]|nr:hypothetical protein BG003_005996 [Podila horticola]
MIHKFEPQDIHSRYLAGLLLLSHTRIRGAELDAETESRLETDFSTFHVTTEIFTRWLQALNAVAQGKIALHDTYLVEVEPADRRPRETHHFEGQPCVDGWLCELSMDCGEMDL